MGKLHFYPSSFSNFQIKSLNFQFNHFNPFPYDISITKYFTWKFKFTLDTKLPFYPFKPSNSIIVQSFEILRMLQSTLLIKISSSKFTYPLYWKDEGIKLTSSSFSYVTSSYDWSFHRTSLIEKSSFLTLGPFCLNSQSTILHKSNFSQ